MISEMTSEIAGVVKELVETNEELKRLTQVSKGLRLRKIELEGNIGEYLKETGQSGVKYKGVVVFTAPKKSRAPKKQKQRTEDGQGVLERYGIHNSKKVLEELLESMRGDVVESTCVKTQEYTPQ
jgi:hypothetical protein